MTLVNVVLWLDLIALIALLPIGIYVQHRLGRKPPQA
jgi:hypothetical protein